jgi:predicted HTH transcriptional regulator
MAMRRIALCEQAGTGMRMMREEWQKLGHPEPFFRNNRSRKYFEFTIPELDKEVDMASDLVKAMFSAKKPTQLPTQLPTQSDDPVMRLLQVLVQGEMSSSKLREMLGIKHRPNFRDNYLHPAIEAGFIEHTIPDKPTTPLQKYRITDKGREALIMKRPEVQKQ